MARQKLGQHFLEDNQISKKIVESGLFSECESVIEIGPGKGSLSDFLVNNNDKYNIYLIEYDSYFSKLLENRFSNENRVEILNIDARTFDLNFLPSSFSTPILRLHQVHCRSE